MEGTFDSLKCSLNKLETWGDLSKLALQFGIKTKEDQLSSKPNPRIIFPIEMGVLFCESYQGLVD
jgi:hypothetical protein